eukprot:11084747-Alexandrium_andersonii.AAC.1
MSDVHHLGQRSLSWMWCSPRAVVSASAGRGRWQRVHSCGRRHGAGSEVPQSRMRVQAGRRGVHRWRGRGTALAGPGLTVTGGTVATAEETCTRRPSRRSGRTRSTGRR